MITTFQGSFVYKRVQLPLYKLVEHKYYKGLRLADYFKDDRYKN